MYWLPILLAAFGGVQAQLTSHTSVAPDLWECYMDPYLSNRNNLSPTTIQVLIDIIQKIEDNPNVNLDLRQLSALLLHTYRQDGIEYQQRESNQIVSSTVLPYATSFHSFHRHRLLLTRLIPSNLQVLANTTLDSPSKCALHHMLSTTVDSRVRGDENMCNQLSQYRALRTARSVKMPSRADADVELLSVDEMNTAKSSNMRQYNPKDDVEYSSYGDAEFEKQVLSQSQCPLLGGVSFTHWGGVSTGNVIAGIAAGAQPQQVPVTQLAKGSVLHYNVQATVNSIYPATLTGDLAEAVLLQGTLGNTQISVGTAGNWNSSQAQRHYMLHNRVNIEMTDPEIRGDIDGFLLGSTITSTLSTYSSLRLSQLLDMYYSSRNGVFNADVRACNRRALSQSNIDTNTLVSETYAFAAALDTNMPLPGTITSGLDSLVNTAVTNFRTYTTSNLNDLSCFTSDGQTPDYRLKTNLYIALDASWQYTAVYPAISYLLDSIEVNKFGSSITLLNALDGSIIVNTTFSQSQFHSEYTLTKHQSLSPGGVNLRNSLSNIHLLMQESLRNESLRNYVGGNATVLLYLINSGNIENNLEVFELARRINDTVPDLRVIYATASNQFDNLWNLVRDMHNDIKTVALSSGGTNVEIIMGSVLDRIRQIGRRVVNPLCGSDFTAGSSGNRQFDDFVEPGYTNFYAISANYFYHNNENRRVRIARSSTGVGSLVICHSRSVPQPRRNTTVVGLDENAITCQTLAASGNVEIRLDNHCAEVSTISSCPPLYLSVQSDNNGIAATSAVCTDNNVCRFPYNIRYQVQIEEFGCFSDASGLGASAILVFILVLANL